MLRFVYQGDHDDAPGATTQPVRETEPVNPYHFGSLPRPPIQPPKTALLVNVKLYVIADKYDIPTLKKFAQDKYTEIVKAHWDTDEFMRSAEITFERTLAGDALRGVVVSTAARHAQTLVEKKEFAEMLAEHGEVAVEVLKKVIAKKEPEEEEVLFIWEEGVGPPSMGRKKKSLGSGF